MSAIGTIHLASAIATLALGLSVLGLRKGTRLHRALGYGWVYSMIQTNATVLSLYRSPGYFEPFHALALVSLASTLAGLAAALIRWRNWLDFHYRFIAFSYLGLLAAATAEGSTRLPQFRFTAAWQVIAVGVGIGVVSTIIGMIVVPRLRRSALVLKAR